jgi:hypothetical protein
MQNSRLVLCDSHAANVNDIQKDKSEAMIFFTIYSGS